MNKKEALELSKDIIANIPGVNESGTNHPVSSGYYTIAKHTFDTRDNNKIEGDTLTLCLDIDVSKCKDPDDGHKYFSIYYVPEDENGVDIDESDWMYTADCKVESLANILIYLEDTFTANELFVLYVKDVFNGEEFVEIPPEISGEILEIFEKTGYPPFDAFKDKARIIEFLKAWFIENGPSANAVIGISGGKDSTITAALCVEALGKDRVVGVIMPNGIQPDYDDALKVVHSLGIKYRTINIGSAFDSMIDSIDTDNAAVCDNFNISITDALRQNLAPRLRMATLYAVAQGLPNGGRVINTCNASEDYVGYSTKYGDSAGDVAPLAVYTVDEVLAIGDILDIPPELVHKAPSDGLCGKTDEDNLGFTYAVLDRYIKTGECDDPEIKKLIEHKHKLNLHKISLMPVVKR